MVSSLQFALVGVNSRPSSCCFARRSDSLSTRCCQVEGVLVLVEEEEDDGDDDDGLEEEGACGPSLSSAGTSTDQKEPQRSEDQDCLSAKSPKIKSR